MSWPKRPAAVSPICREPSGPSSVMAWCDSPKAKAVKWSPAHHTLALWFTLRYARRIGRTLRNACRGIAAMYENLLANVPTDLWIGGKWRKASDGGRFDVVDPATERKIASVASATVDDAKAAIDAAEGAFPA